MRRLALALCCLAVAPVLLLLALLAVPYWLVADADDPEYVPEEDAYHEEGWL